MDTEIHRLLQRQIEKSRVDLLDTEEGQNLVDKINKTYIQFERERRILEESARRMLGKIVESNDNLHTIIDSLDGFNYHISHDLKNSMINALSLGKMIRKYFEREDYRKVNEVVEKLIHTTSGGLELVEKFLRISKFEARLSEEAEELVNIHECMLKNVEHLGLTEKLDLIFVQTDFDAINGKELGLFSLFQNLISNAYKYRKTNERLRIEIRLVREGARRLIFFKDNGIGIDLTVDKDNLFKPFVRLKNSVNQEGSGVGLFLVKKVVVEHHGSIQVNSTPNEGTEFIITF